MSFQPWEASATSVTVTVCQPFSFLSYYDWHPQMRTSDLFLSLPLFFLSLCIEQGKPFQKYESMTHTCSFDLLSPCVTWQTWNIYYSFFPAAASLHTRRCAHTSKAPLRFLGGNLGRFHSQFCCVTSSWITATPFASRLQLEKMCRHCNSALTKTCSWLKWCLGDP